MITIFKVGSLYEYNFSILPGKIFFLVLKIEKQEIQVLFVNTGVINTLNSSFNLLQINEL